MHARVQVSWRRTGAGDEHRSRGARRPRACLEGRDASTTATRECRSWIWAWSPVRCWSTPARYRCWQRRAQGLSATGPATGTLAASSTYTAPNLSQSPAKCPAPPFPSRRLLPPHQFGGGHHLNAPRNGQVGVQEHFPAVPFLPFSTCTAVFDRLDGKPV